MSYELQVVRGRSETTALKLAEGVTSIGRHDACTIRIKSSQVSRRHCEITLKDGKLLVRDLGSSNGTFVNGKRIKEVMILREGDELTIGSISLKVAPATAGAARRAVATPSPSDTAEVEAIPAGDDEQFEIEFDLEPEADQAFALDTDDDPPTQVSPPRTAETPAAAAAPEAEQPADNRKFPSGDKKMEDEAVADFLLDLKLDDE
jgi:pSer/pThr/pTyr-binding forkhead associated (FHA) protein